MDGRRHRRDRRVSGCLTQYEASARVYVDTQSLLRPLLAGMTVMPDAAGQVAILSRTLLTPAQRRQDHPQVRSRHAPRGSPPTPCRRHDGLADDHAQQRATISTRSRFGMTDGRRRATSCRRRCRPSSSRAWADTRTGSDSARQFLDEQIKRVRTEAGRSRRSRARVPSEIHGALSERAGKDYLVADGGGRGSDQGTRRWSFASPSRLGTASRDSWRTSRPTEADASRRTAAPIAVPELDARIDALQAPGRRGAAQDTPTAPRRCQQRAACWHSSKRSATASSRRAARPRPASARRDSERRPGRAAAQGGAERGRRQRRQGCARGWAEYEAKYSAAQGQRRSPCRRSTPSSASSTATTTSRNGSTTSSSSAARRPA